jgi:hypothetical protein
MALIIADRAPTCGSDSIMNRIPSTKTAASATSQLTPNPYRTTENVKYAFNPIPGASANGRFAQSPITTHAMNAATAVAKSASSNGIPVNSSILGLTKRM